MDRKLGGCFKRERSLAVTKMKKKRFRVLGHALRVDIPPNESGAAAAPFHGLAGFHGQKLRGAGKDFFAKAGGFSGNLVEVDPGGVVVFVHGHGKVEFSAGDHLLLCGDLRNAGLVVEAVQVAALFIQATVPDQAPGIQAGEDEDIRGRKKFCGGFGPFDQALGGGRFVAMDSGGEVKRGAVWLFLRVLQIDDFKPCGGCAKDSPCQLRLVRHALPSPHQQLVIVDLLACQLERL